MLTNILKSAYSLFLSSPIFTIQSISLEEHLLYEELKKKGRGGREQHIYHYTKAHTYNITIATYYFPGTTAAVKTSFWDIHLP